MIGIMLVGWFFIPVPFIGIVPSSPMGFTFTFSSILTPWTRSDSLPPLDSGLPGNVQLLEFEGCSSNGFDDKCLLLGDTGKFNHELGTRGPVQLSRGVKLCDHSPPTASPVNIGNHGLTRLAGQDSTSYLSDAEQLLGFFAGSWEHVLPSPFSQGYGGLDRQQGQQFHVSGNQESISPESFMILETRV